MLSRTGPWTCQVAGLVLGDFDGAFGDRSGERHFWQTQMGVPAHVPILAGVPVGHIEHNLVVALGAMGVMDMVAGTLRCGAAAGAGGSPLKPRASP